MIRSLPLAVLTRLGATSGAWPETKRMSDKLRFVATIYKLKLIGLLTACGCRGRMRTMSGLTA